MNKNTMAVDQYGETYHALGLHPRKALLEKLGRQHADKMYIDKKDGTSVHIGYIIGGLWLTLFAVEPNRNESLIP
jgi:hypothetical protein